ncbi:hypothetical protein L9F63_006113, partial [Diploptera punctata]
KRENGLKPYVSIHFNLSSLFMVFGISWCQYFRTCTGGLCKVHDLFGCFKQSMSYRARVPLYLATQRENQAVMT